MECNWKKMKNGMIDVTPFLLFESSADSDDAIADDVLQHHHHHHQEEHEEEEEEQQQEEAMDHDAESCSFDHSFHVNHKTTHDNHHQACGYDGHDDHDHGHGHDDNGEDIDDHDDNNWGESKLIGQLCVDSSNLDDRKFWETCLGS